MIVFCMCAQMMEMYKLVFSIVKILYTVYWVYSRTLDVHNVELPSIDQH